MFCITYTKNGITSYFYRVTKEGKTQVFTFNTPQAAAKCIELYQQHCFSMVMKSNTGDPFTLTKISQECSKFKIEELPNMEAEKVSFEELMKEKGYEI